MSAVNRQMELKQLNTLYEARGNHIVLLYGKMGSEKEAFLRDFTKDKKTIYYRAANASADRQRQLLAKTLEDTYAIRLANDSYEEMFNRVRSGDASKLVLVFDEFQNIAKRDELFLKELLKLKANKYYPGPMLIVLATTSIVFAENGLKELDASFETKIEQKIKLSNLTFLDVVRKFPSYTTSQSVEVYGVIGGVTEYVNRWNPSHSVKENICEHILSEDGFLFGEAERIILSELRELSVYDTILSSLAAGNHKLNDLYLDTGFSRAKISVYLKNLMEFDIVEKIVSFDTGGWENAQKGIYKISDTFVHFWFRFVYPHQSELYLLKPEKFYEKYIEKELENYLNDCFVKVCREYIELLNQVKQLPISIHRIGTWIGKQGNIDVVAQDKARNGIVALCNWDKPELTTAMCDSLLKNMKLAKVNAQYIYLFSAKRFQPALEERVKQDAHFVLIDMNEL